VAVGSPLKAEYFHIAEFAFGVGVPFQSRMLPYCSCLWESLWKQSS